MEANKNLLPSDCPPLHTVKQMLKFILEENCFRFDDEFYRQIHGTAMGTICAPPYSSIFMGNMENQKILPIALTILFWKRFIDDIFSIFIGSEEELLALFRQINQLHPIIKFSFHYSQTSVEFLDIRIIKDANGYLYSDLYRKPTDTRALLHYTSFHPASTKDSIIYSQALRYRMLITRNDDLNIAFEDLRASLIFRGYPNQILTRTFEKVKRLTQRELLVNTNKVQPQNNNKKILPFIVPYCKSNKEIKKSLLKNWHLIENDPELSKIWPNPPILANTRHPNLKDLLVHTSSPHLKPS